MSIENFDYKFKIILLGKWVVGKTSLISRYIDNIFKDDFISPIGTYYETKNFDINNKKIKAYFWDRSENEHHIPIIFYKGSHGCIIIYDVNNKESYNEVREWIEKAKTNALKSARIILVGNKIDLTERKITVEEGKKLAEELGVKYFETSAKTDDNVKEAFDFLIKDILDNYKNISDNSIKLKNNYDTNKNNRCSM